MFLQLFFQESTSRYFTREPWNQLDRFTCVVGWRERKRQTKRTIFTLQTFFTIFSCLFIKKIWKKKFFYHGKKTSSQLFQKKQKKMRESDNDAKQIFLFFSIQTHYWKWWEFFFLFSFSQFFFNFFITQADSLKMIFFFNLWSEIFPRSSQSCCIHAKEYNFSREYEF